MLLKNREYQRLLHCDHINHCVSRCVKLLPKLRDTSDKTFQSLSSSHLCITLSLRTAFSFHKSNTDSISFPYFSCHFNAPLNSCGPTEVLLVRLAPRKETNFKKL